MDSHKHWLDRRDFLKAGLGAAAATAAFPSGDAQAETPAAKAISVEGNPIPVRTFGKTGYRFPVLGLGGAAFITRDAPYYGVELPPVEERIKLVRTAYDKGVRYFDTARIYEESEHIVGEALKDIRDQVYIASKVLVHEPEKARESVETSLKELQMDRIDCFQVHGPAIEKIKFEGAMKLYEELVKLREEGLFRFIGLTGHSSYDEMYKMISTGNFDQVLIEFGYIRKGIGTRHSNTMLEWREMCLAKATELQMGVVAMKVLCANVFSHNALQLIPDYDAEAAKRLPGAAMRWTLSDPRVHVLNIGMSFVSDIEENVKMLTGDVTLTNQDRLLLADFAEKAYRHPKIENLPIV
ncbi:MAG: aldo/keto reductase [Candidatus Hydrogenedentes bacterium]|nr:aldo/keto reductase [Candidatus Hydrogenedentota bacterium]